MTPRERFAAQLLKLYWTGAGDSESAIINFRDVIEEIDDKLSIALENGQHTILSRYNGYSVTMTNHFLMIAEKLIDDLNENKYQQARLQIKAEVKQNIINRLIKSGATEAEVENIRVGFEKPEADALITMLISFSDDPRIGKLVKGK